MIRIAVAGVLGYETVCGLLREHQEELENRFSKHFLRSVRRTGLYAVEKEKAQPKDSEGLLYTAPIEEGGLLASLWKACEDLKEEPYGWAQGYTGCEVDLEKVPIRQEITEICELYRENPYEVPSEGAWLVIWEEDREEDLPKSTLYMIEQSAIIGKLTKKNRRILYENGRIRYLTPPGRQKKDIMNRKNEV